MFCTPFILEAAGMNIFRTLMRYARRYLFIENSFADNTTPSKSDNMNHLNDGCLFLEQIMNISFKTFSDECFFTINNKNDITELIINKNHPASCSFSFQDKSHPLFFLLATWVKLNCYNTSKIALDSLNCAKSLWERELFLINSHELDFCYDVLPTYILFDVRYINGKPQLIINNKHIFYTNFLTSCDCDIYLEFVHAVMAWAIAECNALSQRNLHKMINARIMLNNFLYDFIDDALEDLETNNEK